MKAFEFVNATAEQRRDFDAIKQRVEAEFPGMFEVKYIQGTWDDEAKRGDVAIAGNWNGSEVVKVFGNAEKVGLYLDDTASLRRLMEATMPKDTTPEANATAYARRKDEEAAIIAKADPAWIKAKDAEYEAISRRAGQVDVRVLRDNHFSTYSLYTLKGEALGIQGSATDADRFLFDREEAALMKKAKKVLGDGYHIGRNNIGRGNANFVVGVIDHDQVRPGNPSNVKVIANGDFSSLSASIDRLGAEIKAGISHGPNAPRREAGDPFAKKDTARERGASKGYGM
ncbi:hypothetical protein BB934_45110 (plasmid) [Microvirga ossetica]|uniref:Uncharacterized protein n=1 Tax=Microvirga ossetica TaxID=1882682 RepID=A0A1B2EZK6_9HYPH|nr:hypothetical protein [Microvirga ossetica]ANY85401.1 hypothetical protein BB934_45110 [Microvirga ossetica]